MSEFDYIVVGAGSAGCVLAARLSEDGAATVLLLEAGGADRRAFLSMPIAARQVSQDRGLNWNFQSEPEPWADGRNVRIPRGKVLGGSSTINGMTWMRGHPADYDQWRQMGLAGWSYADVLPYFRKLESHWRGEGPYHGGGGPVRVSPSRHPALAFEALARAAGEAGIPVTEDFAGARPEGIGRPDLSVGRGRRASTASAYLRPALGRPNLTVATGALTTRLLVEGGRAAGVEYRRHGAAIEARARREVILAGGAYGSPQVLMLSGIGPADELRALGIAPVLDLPGVGANLSEHPNARTQFLAREPLTLMPQFRFDRALRWAVQWRLFGTGLFATNGSVAHIFARSRDGLEAPDLQISCPGARLDARLWFPFVRPMQAHRWEPGVILLRPRSRGRVTLRSADPAAPPRIHLDLFREPADLEAMVRGVRLAREVFGPARGLSTRELAPGPERASDAEIAAWVRRVSTTTQHPCGTCAMGSGADAVVDAELRLRGLAGLRVVDASVMPTVPAGNINAPVIMIAEKAADLIRGRPPLPREMP